MTTQDDIVALEAFDRDADLAQFEAMLREFNLFDVLGIARREVRHSRILAWLLNPRGTHGIGDAFLRWFLLEVATIAETQGVGNVTTREVIGWRLEQVSARAERRNIDVLVLGQGDRFACAIENKINIGEHSNQLERYRKVVERQHPDWKHVYVFLTPDGREPAKDADKAAYVPLKHEAVARIIERLLASEDVQANPDVASLLRQYTFTLRERVMESTGDATTLALQIYGKHRTAIDRINRALNNKVKIAERTMQAVVKEELEEASNGLFEFSGHNKRVRSFVVPDLDIFGDQGQRLFFQVKHERDTNWYLWVRSGGAEVDDIRKRLIGLPHRSSAPFSIHAKKSKKLPKGSSWIYRKQIISRNDAAILDYDAAKAKVERAIQDFCETDYFPLVNAIRQEFGLEPVSPA